MHKIKRELFKIICYLALAAAILVNGSGAIFLQRPLTADNVFSSLGTVTLLAYGLWLIWDHFLWKCELCQKYFGVTDISGRWCGTYRRDNSDGESDCQDHGYALEIKQTFSSVSCSTYQDNGTASAATIADITKLPDEDTGIIFCWEGRRAPVEMCEALKEENPVFHGTTILSFSPKTSTGAASLSGDYYTDGGTKGIVRVQYKGKTLLRRYEPEETPCTESTN